MSGDSVKRADGRALYTTPPPPVEPIDLTGGIAEHLRTAFTSLRSPMLAYTALDGTPRVSMRGSIRVLEPDKLTMWARRANSGVAVAIVENPDVAITYWNPNNVGPFYFEILGRARLAPELDDSVYEAMDDGEQGRDPDRWGVAVLIEVDSVVGSIFDEQPDADRPRHEVPSHWARKFVQGREVGST